jgi:uncharacterized protein (DUF1697 family)
MTRFVALLRGINVAKANRIPMAELRALLESIGYGEVRTLLNSGNAVFESTGKSSSAHAKRIQDAILEHFALDVPVIVKSAKELAAIEAENKLAAIATDPSRFLVAFTPDGKSLKALAPIAALVKAPERIHLGENAVYLWCANGILESKAANALLGKVGRVATTRNWATVLKLHALLREPAE